MTSPDWIDRFAASDPGQNRLRMALQVTVTIGLALAAAFLFVHLTHALQIDTHGVALPAAQAAVIAGQHHALLVIGMMLGAIMAMLGSFAVNMESDPRKQLIMLAFLPVPMSAALVLGLSIGGHRVLALASLVVLLAAGSYLRRFGPIGLMSGQMLFMGDFFGYFLHSTVALAGVGWLIAEIALGSLVTIVVHLVLFFPDHRKALNRLRRSYAGRSRAVTEFIAELFEEPADSDRTTRQLRRHVVRLNEAALMIDAQLAEPEALPTDSSAVTVHQRLFDTELALTNLARFAEAIVHFQLPEQLLALIRRCAFDIRDENYTQAELHAHDLLDAIAADETLEHRSRVILHRFATSAIAYAQAVVEWLDPAITETDPTVEFQPSVSLAGGFLPGSAQVSAQASTERGPRLVDRIRLAPYERVAVQMTVAVTLAIIFGDLLSGRRFYWAVIAAFVTFMGANNAAEQTRKGIFRVVGTFVGIMIGATLAHLVGTHTNWSVVVILGAVFLGVYLMRVNYAFMVIGITVMVSQLYVQLEEFSNSLLLLRLAETALGAGCAILTVLLVLPLRTGHVARVAARAQISAVAELADAACARLLDRPSDTDLRASARRLDAAQQTLLATTNSMRTPIFGRRDSELATFVQRAVAAHNYARNLVVDLRGTPPVEPAHREDLAVAAQTLATSLAELVSALSDERAEQPPVYVRSAGLFTRVATELDEQDYLAPVQLALRDLQLLDGALAAVAAGYRVGVRDLDTAAPVPLATPQDAG